jgi:hypothetical protein
MYLSPCLFHIVCCICCSFLYICINIFSNVIYNFCLHVVLTKSHLISLFFVTWSPLYILSIKAYLISRPPLETPDERSSLEKSKLSLYFSGSCIPINESLFFFRPPSLRDWFCHLSMYLWGWIYSLPIHSGNLNVSSSSANCTRVWNAAN